MQDQRALRFEHKKNKISNSRHALFIVVAYIMCLTFNNLIYYLYTHSEEAVFVAIGSVVTSAPFLLVSLLLLPFVKSSLEKHTLKWCAAVTISMTAIFTLIFIFAGMNVDLLLIPIFVFSAACMASLLYYFCVSKQLNKGQPTTKSTTFLFLTALTFCILTPLAGFNILENYFRLQHTPMEFGVSKIVYAKEEGGGFGPGGNETGIIVYELPEDAKQKIVNGKISYLNNLASKGYGGENWQGRYPEWFETPVNLNNDWIGASSDGEHPISDKMPDKPHIYSYLDRYGFGIPLDDKVERMINDAISKPRNFYAYGRTGFILIIPERRKIVYAYSG